MKIITIQEDALEEAVTKILDKEGLGLPHEWDDFLYQVTADDFLDGDQKRDSIRILVEAILNYYLGAESFRPGEEAVRVTS